METVNSPQRSRTVLKVPFIFIVTFKISHKSIWYSHCSLTLFNIPHDVNLSITVVTKLSIKMVLSYKYVMDDFTYK